MILLNLSIFDHDAITQKNMGHNNESQCKPIKKYSKFKKKLVPCDKSEIFKNINVKLATDASLNLTKFKNIK